MATQTSPGTHGTGRGATKFQKLPTKTSARPSTAVRAYLQGVAELRGWSGTAPHAHRPVISCRQLGSVVSFYRRRRKWNSAILAIAFLGTLILVGTTVFRWHLQTRLHVWFADRQLVAWVGIAVNLAVVVVALLLNVLLEQARRPRFAITLGAGPPWQVEKRSSGDDPSSLIHVRLRVQNIGRTCEDRCEIRIEQVLYLYSTKGLKPESIADHDPRSLKWAGRDTRPINLNVGAFDFADLAVRRLDSPNLVRLEFAERGHLDLWGSEKNIVGYRVIGTAYGTTARPKSFKFDLSWNEIEASFIAVREV